MTQTSGTIKHARLGLRIRKARVEAGLSQEAFADKISTSRRHVMRLEKGLHRPTQPMLSRIAEVTGTDARTILGDLDDEDESEPMSIGEAIERMFEQFVDRKIREREQERAEVMVP